MTEIARNTWKTAARNTPGIHGWPAEFIVDIPRSIVLLFYVNVTRLDAQVGVL